MIIILQRALLSQALTDSIRTQHEEGQIVKDNGGCFTCKILFSCTFDVCLVVFLVSQSVSRQSVSNLVSQSVFSGVKMEFSQRSPIIILFK